MTNKHYSAWIESNEISAISKRIYKIQYIVGYEDITRQSCMG